MAYPKRFFQGTRYRKKRTNRKRKSKRKSKLSLYSSMPPALRTNTYGLGKSKKVNLRYVDEVTLATGAIGVPTNYVYRANSIFDPDYTGTGHQPIGSDQWGAFYNYYCVIGANITVEFINDSETIPVCCGVQIQRGTGYTGTNSIGGRAENPSNVHKVLGVLSSTPTALVLRNKVAPLKYMKKKFNDPDTQAVIGANPAEDLMFSIWAASMGGQASVNVDMIVTIDYVVVYTDPKEITQS